MLTEMTEYTEEVWVRVLGFTSGTLGLFYQQNVRGIQILLASPFTTLICYATNALGNTVTGSHTYPVIDIGDRWNHFAFQGSASNGAVRAFLNHRLAVTLTGAFNVCVREN